MIVDVSFKQVKKNDVSEEIICQLIDKVACGIWRPGSKIPSEAELCEAPSLALLSAMPDVMCVTQAQDDAEAIAALTQSAASAALAGVCDMRTAEGAALCRDVEYHLSSLAALRDSIAQKAPTVVEAYRQKLEARLAELPFTPVEPQRLAQEVALFADKCAIDEELSRLLSHMTQLRQCIAADEDMGRKLDFLVQELNREVNTIGSKASDAEITGWVVSAKSTIEKLREQVQNIE